jgi:hypothetical protein
LKTGARRPDESWCDAVVVLGDGTEIRASVYQTTFEKVWRPLLGKTVSIIARASVDATAPGRRFKLVGQTAICAGKVERCGMGRDVWTRNRGPMKIR